MAKTNIKKNYIYNLSYQILLVIIPLITTPYLSRVLGADGIGTISFAESIVSYFVLFGTFGITIFGQREISYVQDSVEKRSQAFWETKCLEFITAGTALLLYIPFALSRPQNRIIYLFLSFNIIAVIFDVTWFFQGLEEFGKIVLRNFLFKLINVIYIFVFIKTKNDMVWYAFGPAFLSFLSNLSLWLYLPQYIQAPDWAIINPFRNFKIVLALFVPTIAFSITAVLDKTMIGMITKSAFENGYYEQAMKICRITLTLVTALGTVMIPRIGYLFSKGEDAQVKAYIYRGYRFVWFIGIPLSFGILGTASNFVPWFFGEGFEKVIPLLGILGFLIISNGISNVTGVQYLIPTKRENLFTKTVFIGALINFTLNSFLIYFYKSVGAAIASIIAETCVALIQIYILRQELSIRTIFFSAWKYLLAGGLMLILLRALGSFLSPSVIHTAIMALAGAALYFAALTIMKDDFFLSNLRNVLFRIKARLHPE